MSSRTYGYIFNALILFGAHSFAHAQKEKAEADTVVAVSDSTASKFIPTGIRFGVDLLAIGKSFITNDFNGWEVAADVDFYRYYLVAEYGSWGVQTLIDNPGTYTSQGTYFRIGADVNFLFKDPNKNMFFLGGRFGRSSFSDEATYQYVASPFDNGVITVSNSHVIGTWVELVTGLKVKIWGAFWLGATGRLKFGLDLDGNGALKSYEVPGYGKNYKSTWLGFNYYAFVRIPVRKKK